MAVIYYDAKNPHPTGWVGARAASSLGNSTKTRQRYFSLKKFGTKKRCMELANAFDAETRRIANKVKVDRVKKGEIRPGSIISNMNIPGLSLGIFNTNRHKSPVIAIYKLNGTGFRTTVSFKKRTLNEAKVLVVLKYNQINNTRITVNDLPSDKDFVKILMNVIRKNNYPIDRNIVNDWVYR